MFVCDQFSSIPPLSGHLHFEKFSGSNNNNNNIEVRSVFRCGTFRLITANNDNDNLGLCLLSSSTILLWFDGLWSSFKTPHTHFNAMVWLFGHCQTEKNWRSSIHFLICFSLVKTMMMIGSRWIMISNERKKEKNVIPYHHYHYQPALFFSFYYWVTLLIKWEMRKSQKSIHSPSYVILITIIIQVRL